MKSMPLVEKFLSENKDILNLTEAYQEGSVETMLPDQYMRLAIEHSSAKAPILSALKLYRYDNAGSIYDNMSTHDDDREQLHYHVKSFCPLLQQPVVGLKNTDTGETILVSCSKEAMDIVVGDQGIPTPSTKEEVTPKAESFLNDFFPEVNEELSYEEKEEFETLKAKQNDGTITEEERGRMGDLARKSMGVSESEECSLEDCKAELAELEAKELTPEVDEAIIKLKAKIKELETPKE